jgi:hypothetical protein
LNFAVLHFITCRGRTSHFVSKHSNLRAPYSPLCNRNRRLFARNKTVECETERSLPSSAQIKRAWNMSSTLHLRIHGVKFTRRNNRTVAKQLQKNEYHSCIMDQIRNAVFKNELYTFNLNNIIQNYRRHWINHAERMKLKCIPK